MRILFLSALYPPNTKGGGEVSTHLIAQGLQARGHDVEVITSGIRAEERVVEGVRVRQLALSLTAKPLLEQRHARKMAQALAKAIGDPTQYDVIHAHDFRTAQALSELNWPNTIVTARDYAQICGSPNNILADGSLCPGCTFKNVLRNQAVVEAPLWRKPFRIWQYRYNIDYRLTSFQKFKHQIFISKAQHAQIARHQDLRHTTTHVVYNPAPPRYLKDSPVRPVDHTLLYVGTIQAYKGVGVLLEAFRALAKRYPNIQLKLVGEGAARAAYERQVGTWGLQYRVSFVGRIPHDRMQTLYDEATLLVAPHLWLEPFGRTVAEAMARGKVVIAADVGGPAEIIQDGKTGFLFPRGDSSALAGRIAYVLQMNHFDRREIEDNARRWVQQHLAPDIIAAQHEAIYSELRA
jgi:glycosyltransferase involved in cell wall biosynthesis